MVGIELDKLVWNLGDGSDPEIFIRNTSPQILISVNFYLFFYSCYSKNLCPGWGFGGGGGGGGKPGLKLNPFRAIHGSLGQW